jgi:cytoskeletal protein RodZ
LHNPTKETTQIMFERFRGKAAGATLAALLAALGVGGVAAAQNGSAAPPAQTQAPSSSSSSTAPSSAATEVPGQESTAPDNSAADPDNVQQGDTAGAATAATAPDVPTAGDTPDTGSAGTAATAPDVPTAGDTPDTGSAAEAPGSEVAGNDGPGGHADEPGNPAADHQATGVE